MGIKIKFHGIKRLQTKRRENIAHDTDVFRNPILWWQKIELSIDSETFIFWCYLREQFEVKRDARPLDSLEFMLLRKIYAFSKFRGAKREARVIRSLRTLLSPVHFYFVFDFDCKPWFAPLHHGEHYAKLVRFVRINTFDYVFLSRENSYNLINYFWLERQLRNNQFKLKHRLAYFLKDFKRYYSEKRMGFVTLPRGHGFEF
jgi:hypothetical protein